MNEGKEGGSGGLGEGGFFESVLTCGIICMAYGILWWAGFWGRGGLWVMVLLALERLSVSFLLGGFEVLSRPGAGVFFGALALYCFDPVLFAVVAFYSIAVLFILYDCSVIHSKSRGI